MEIEQAGLSAGQSAVTLAVFIAIATASVAAPVALYFTLGKRAEETLNVWKAWLIANNSTVMAVLFFVIGVWLVAQGTWALAN